MGEHFDTTASSKGNHYARASEQLRLRVAAALPREEVRCLHERRPAKHFAIVGGMVSILAASAWGLATITNPLIWLPLAFVAGFIVFDFTVLLHEVVHDAVLRDRRTGWNRVLGYCYAVPSGISATQFTRWHLDHHAELGSDTDDPKRFHLSPKRNARWYKLLYFTPALFFIYFQAAAPSNLVTLLESIPPYWESRKTLFGRAIGDPQTESGRSLLRERSPLTHVDKIKKPLLIGQGANDPRVKQAESDQIVEAMKSRGIPVTYVLYPDEGHGFQKPENILSFFAVAEAFLAECQGGRYQSLGDDFANSSIQIPHGGEFIPGIAGETKSE